MNAPPPQPMFFGREGRLFGWLHRPPAGSASAFGLVICNPFGFEEVCAHRSLRHFAEAAAAAGVPALRFDYDGCGNSQGDDFEPDRLACWVASVHEAIDAVKRASGVPRVCLLGLRLGALLAASAAGERDDIAGLVAIAPVVRGRAYLRELTLLGAAGADGSGELLESAGYLLTSATREALAAVDLRASARRPAPKVLIVERDDMPATSDWPDALQRLGAEVTLAGWPGYAAMVDDPQRAVVPQRIVEGVLAGLASWQAGQRPVEHHVFGQASVTAGAPRRAEAVVGIDAGDSRLFGILTTGADGPVAGGPAVLMLNSGSVHLIGPNRLWVRLARRWAERGVTVLRLDIAGIGDSPPRPGCQENVVYSAHAIEDVEAAVEWLRKRAGAGECHLLGLCSGAYHALKAAIAARGVASSTMINPLTYFWKQGAALGDLKDYEVLQLTSKYRDKLWTLQTWKRLLRGQLDLRLIAQVGLRRARDLLAPQARALARLLHIPHGDDLDAELAMASRKGIRLRFVFAAQAPGYALLRQQSSRAITHLLDGQQGSIDFVPDADHTFTRLEARERLVATLERLMAPVVGGNAH